MTVSGSTTGSNGRYHVQLTATDPRAGFPYASHHDSVSALWSRKWRMPATRGIYPFADGDVADFEPIFAELVRISDDDTAFLYRPDDYAEPFFPVAQRLVADAEEARSQGDLAVARALFLRAAAVYRIARFPINRSPSSQEAWEKGKAAYEQGAALLDPPNTTVEIPFAHADTTAGDLDRPIQAYLRVPDGAAPQGGRPIALLISGLDGYQTDLTDRAEVHLGRGRATLTFEIPGTGDCPAAPNDPTSSDRLVSSVLHWVAANASKHAFDLSKIVAHGFSTGGYSAIRAAHTHADRLLAVVAQGGGGHHMFDAEWIRAQNQMDYPFALAEALAWKFGYRDADPAAAVERYAAEAHKFSLLDTGVLATPSCRLLVINGLEDTIFPVEDSILAATRGAGTDLIARGNRPHMGNPGAEPLLFAWLDNAIAGNP